MRIIKAKNYRDLSRKAANIISAQIILKPECVLGLATGSTPVGTYNQLVELYQNGDLDFSKVSTVNLDEYKGIDRENEQSYYHFMQHNLFEHINISDDRVHILDGMQEDAEKECGKYEQLIDSLGGIDLQLLGLGHNGHIGFNEPGAEFIKDTHCVNLSKRTIEANKRFFNSDEDVPRQAYTMGIGTIMKAKKVLLIVSGQDKAETVAKAFAGKITPEVPASVLQLHNDVTVIADKLALEVLEEYL